MYSSIHVHGIWANHTHHRGKTYDNTHLLWRHVTGNISCDMTRRPKGMIDIPNILCSPVAQHGVLHLLTSHVGSQYNSTWLCVTQPPAAALGVPLRRDLASPWLPSLSHGIPLQHDSVSLQCPCWPTASRCVTWHPSTIVQASSLSSTRVDHIT